MASHITELKTTVYRAPVISTLFGWISRGILRLIGWKIIGDPPTHKKYVLIAAPHTSNWDFLLFLLLAFIKKFDVHWMGKDALFPWPIKGFMVWLGGIPIDRSKANNLVEQMVDYFERTEQLGVLITPEGTRSKVERWKTGFYNIARQADLPIVLGFVDGANKTVGFGPTFQTTGDLEVDLQAIQAYYKDMQGIVPDNG